MVKDIKELTFPEYAMLSNATVNFSDMGEKTITAQVKIDGDITPDFSMDWEVEFQGEKYIMPLRQPQGAKENTSLNSTIDLTFQHWAIYQLKRWKFFTVQSTQAGIAVPDKYIADVVLNLPDFCHLFGQVLQHFYGDTITIDLNPEWNYKEDATPVSINHSFIWNVLIKLYEVFAVRWQIEANGDNDHYVIRVGYPTTEIDHTFEYGFDGGLLKVERQIQSDDIHNMILGRGGEKNLPRYYFKKSSDEEKAKSDPDWIEELKDIYFDRLRGATFRSYVQGWKAAHRSKYLGYIPKGEANTYAPWAYLKGYTDTKFDPIEYVKNDESIEKYGPLLDGLDNNDDIYPTIQGSGMDIVVAVEQVESDDVKNSIESDANISDQKGLSVTTPVGAKQRVSVSIDGEQFTVPTGKHANFDDGEKTIQLSIGKVVKSVKRVNGRWIISSQTVQVPVNNDNVIIEDALITIVNAVTNETQSASGIPEGTYFPNVTFKIYNGSSESLNVTVSCENVKITDATLDKQWTNTFDIWVKNIWETTKYLDESNDVYAARVWGPILGDRTGGEAKVLFTTGALAVSEDYEFVIVKTPVLDTSQTYEQRDKDGNVIATHDSHWRITLAKSDADLESTGLYVPSTKRQGMAGDKIAFVGTEMTHKYTLWNEIALDDWKQDLCNKSSEIDPTFVVTFDRIRLNDEGKNDALIKQLKVGCSLRLADKRFLTIKNDNGEVVPSSAKSLYIQSLTYTYREPTSDDAALNPDVEIVLSNDYTTVANPISSMQGEVSAIQRQLGSTSNIEQIVTNVCDRRYLRKDGLSDRSQSPTQFYSLLTSGDFRGGIVGGAGWGFYKDENGNWVCEADRFNARQSFQANNFVINQILFRGGMIVESAAQLEITRVVKRSVYYECYFDQKGGSVLNLFQNNDFAMCMRFDNKNNRIKYYRRRVIGTFVDRVRLMNTASTSDGDGIPEEGDIIVHFGNASNKSRQYVKIRDVIGGGYERYLGGLDSVNATGYEYFFVGKQDGEPPRFLVGAKDEGQEYLEFIEGSGLIFKGSVSIGSTIGDVPAKKIAELGFLSDSFKDAKNELTTIQDGLILTSEINLGRTTDNDVYEIKSGISALTNNENEDQDIAIWAGGRKIDANDDPINGAVAAIRHDGSAYFAKNTIKFTENALQVGEYLSIDDESLKLVDEKGRLCLDVNSKTTNISASDAATPPAIYTFGTREVSSKVYTYSPTSALTRLAAIFPLKKTTFPSPVLEGSKVHLDVNVAFGYLNSFPNPPYGVESVYRIKIILKDSITNEQTVLITQDFQFPPQKTVPSGDPLVSSKTIYAALGTVDVTIPASGTLIITREGVFMDHATDYDWQGYSGRIISDNTKITINNNSSTGTFIAGDCFITRWGNATIAASTSECVMGVGKRRIRIDATGIYINRDDGKGEVLL